MAAPPARLGPDPVLISRREVEALYDIVLAVTAALSTLGIEYIVTGGSLLGAVRQHSILFCDDDVDLAIVDFDGTAYPKAQEGLANLLGDQFKYTARPWEGGDKVRHTRVSSVFLDVFTLRRYSSEAELVEVLGVKRNGQPQTDEYVQGILKTIKAAAVSQGEREPLWPCWHFNTRKAVEMWPKEVYRENELLPLSTDLKFGPLTDIAGPRTPVTLLKRAFGVDCFEVYYQSASHKIAQKSAGGAGRPPADTVLQPLLTGGGSWEGGAKLPLLDAHFVPTQPEPKAKRRPTLHDRDALRRYLQAQSTLEVKWLGLDQSSSQHCPAARPRRTVYMDGVFDLFHVGHVRAIQQCIALGDRVIIGVTGDADAADYKRPPIICETDRVAVVEAMRGVDKVICPCPLIVTAAFMAEHGIDLVVHGYANPADAERQSEFFAEAAAAGKFQTIGYYDGLSSSSIIAKVQQLDHPSKTYTATK